MNNMHRSGLSVLALLVLTPAVALADPIDDAQAQHRAMCAASWPARVASAQGDVKAWAKWLVKIGPSAKRIVATCSYVPQTVPGSTETVHEDGKWVTRPLTVTRLSCAGGIPKGLTEEDVMRVLYFSDESAKLVTDVGGTCKDVDPETLDVYRTDVEGMKRVAALKP